MQPTGLRLYRISIHYPCKPVNCDRFPLLLRHYQQLPTQSLPRISARHIAQGDGVSCWSVVIVFGDAERLAPCSRVSCPRRSGWRPGRRSSPGPARPATHSSGPVAQRDQRITWMHLLVVVRRHTRRKRLDTFALPRPTSLRTYTGPTAVGTCLLSPSAAQNDARHRSSSRLHPHS